MDQKTQEESKSKSGGKQIVYAQIRWGSSRADRDRPADPAGLANLLEKIGMLEPLENSLRIEELPYFSTHPPIHERVLKLRKLAG